MPSDTDRHLLFGLLALQNGLIQQAQLVSAFHAWTIDKGRPLVHHLVALGHLNDSQRTAIEALAALHVEAHDGDPEKSLAALTVGHSTREHLRAIADPAVHASLAGVGRHPAEPDADRTETVSFGKAAGDGQRFRVLRPHARGGLGAVFVALDVELNREVALKEILADRADDPVSRQRFLLEAEITAGLEHPGIVPMYGLGAGGGGRPYYAMRFIRGDTLKDAISRFHADRSLKRHPGRRSLELRKLLRRFLDVCNAIEYAHSRGVLHRDIKPANVILGQHGETLVVDWGLAKVVGRPDDRSTTGERTLVPSLASRDGETLPGSALGTPGYMSPEQARGDLDALGPRSDIYSLGATLYSLLTGRAPFEGGDLGEVLRRVQAGDFPRPRAIEPSIDRALEAVCLKAMALRPERRYASPRALADDIERWTADEPVTARREPPARRARRWASAHRTAVTWATFTVLAGLVGVAAVVQTYIWLESELVRMQLDQQTVTQRETYDLYHDAAISLAAGSNDDAIKLYEAALKLYVRRFGLDHASTIESRRRLAAAYQAGGRNDDAIKLYETDLRLDEAKLDPHNSGPLQSLLLLAAAYQAVGRNDDAIKLYETDLKRCEAKFGPDNSVTRESRRRLAAAYVAVGRGADAEPILRALLDPRRRGRSERHLLDYDLAGLGMSLLTQSKWSEAEPVLRECLAIREKSQPNVWTRFHAMSLLGEALTGQGKYAEAEPLVVGGFEGLKAREGEIPALGTFWIPKAAPRVVRLYERWGKPARADAWKAKLGLADLPADVFAPP